MKQQQTSEEAIVEINWTPLIFLFTAVMPSNLQWGHTIR
jgi:hypothetical protein